MHGCIPRKFRETAVIPILKDKAGDRNNPDNYRGTVISSVLEKLIEKIVMAKFQSIGVQTSNNSVSRLVMAVIGLR